MPTRQEFREWCKTCQEFELHVHHYPDWDKKFCKKCGTELTSVKLSEIPKEKIAEQRARYREMNKRFVEEFLSNMYLFGGYNPLVDMFKEVGDDVEIRECDAGQRRIDEANKKKREAEMKARAEERQRRLEEAAKYKRLGRNDKCACGSGKKFKKCCLQKVQAYL